jgi:hypothetical protein
VKLNDDKLFDALELYFNPHDLWSDFEGTLAYLDTEQIVDEASNYLQSYSADDWSESGHHDYQNEIQNRINLLTEQLKIKFTDWIFQLEIPENENLLHLETKATFLTFNYTKTLESLYNIPELQIFYIHNKIRNNNSNLILGHGRDPSSANNYNSYVDDDVRINEGNKIIDQYFVDTYKSTKKIIDENQLFFTSLNEIREIYILGHSLSSVDIPYFEEIIKNIDLKKVQFKVSYYNNYERDHHFKVLTTLGIEQNNIILEKINVLCDPYKDQLKLF